MIPKIIVYTRKRALGCFLIGLYQTNWLVVTIAIDHCRVNTRPIIIVVRLLSDLGAGWVSWQVVTAGLLHKGCIGTATVAGWPAIIVQPDRPRQRGGCRRITTISISIPISISVGSLTVSRVSTLSCPDNST